MRSIEVADGVTVRFPSRSEEFDQGVEIGALAAALALAPVEHWQRLSPGNSEQARALAEAMGFRMLDQKPDAPDAEIVFVRAGRRPALRLVHSAEKAG
jgi:hypothetical protein